MDKQALLAAFLDRKLTYYCQRYPTLNALSIIQDGDDLILKATVETETDFPDKVPVNGIMIPVRTVVDSIEFETDYSSEEERLPDA